MKKLIFWLERGPSGFSLIYVVPLLVFFKISYCLCLLPLVQYLPGKESFSSSIAKLGQINQFKFEDYFNLYGAVLLEELIFRLIPIFIIQEILSFVNIKINLKVFILIICIIFSSVIFGYMHGNYINIFFQGFGGLIYSFVFLKYGGYDLTYQDSSFNSFEALIVCVVTHFCYNMTILKIFC